MIKICTRCGEKWEEFNSLSYENLCPKCKKKKQYWFHLDKKGTSMGNYNEAILFIVAIIGIFLLINGEMASIYGTKGDASYGFATEGIQERFQNLSESFQNQTRSGISIANVFGLSIDTLWTMVQSMMTVVWAVISGNWIFNAVNLLQIGGAGVIIAGILQLLVILSIGYIIIRIITKVEP